MAKKSSILEIRQGMDRIESTLDSGCYRVGDWQKCLVGLKGLGRDVMLTLSEDLTRISNKLHRRNRFPEAPFWAGLFLVFSSDDEPLGHDGRKHPAAGSLDRLAGIVSAATDENFYGDASWGSLFLRLPLVF